MLLGLIVLSITLAAVHLWHEQNAATLARALVAEREQAAATERLTMILRHANDIVFLTDETGQILEANERALEAQLTVSDDGNGLPADFEAVRAKSLGLQLVSDLARQLGGRLRIGPGPQALFKVTFRPSPTSGLN